MVLAFEEPLLCFQFDATAPTAHHVFLWRERLIGAIMPALYRFIGDDRLADPAAVGAIAHASPFLCTPEHLSLACSRAYVVR